MRRSCPPGTIRHLLRRNRRRIICSIRGRKGRKGKREFIDWYSSKPFEIVQTEVKFIRDQKASAEEQIIHLDQYGIPNYQWGALNITCRFKLIGFSQEKSWANDLRWYLWVISWLRSRGVTYQIIFTADNGEEFGGKSWLKVKELRRLIAGLGFRLIQNYKSHPEENAHLKRSPRADDEEFSIPRILKIKSKDGPLEETFSYFYYYNNVRKHSSPGHQTSYQYLKGKLPRD
ncbi:hypothetical protein KBI33_03510 [Candidatus Shapirobacteria bacterium]|nr:hypothetical protein [Candidatus Shapirobacteria bacterium]